MDVILSAKKMFFSRYENLNDNQIISNLNKPMMVQNV